MNDNNENSNGNSPKKQAKTNANSKNLDPIIKEEENGVLSLKKESSTSLQDQDLDLNPHWHQLKPLLCPIHLTTIHLMFIY